MISSFVKARAAGGVCAGSLWDPFFRALDGVEDFLSAAGW